MGRVRDLVDRKGTAFVYINSKVSQDSKAVLLFDVPSWIGFAATLPARASAAVRLTMDGIVAIDRGDS